MAQKVVPFEQEDVGTVLGGEDRFGNRHEEGSFDMVHSEEVVLWMELVKRYEMYCAEEAATY